MEARYGGLSLAFSKDNFWNTIFNGAGLAVRIRSFRVKMR